MKVLAQVRVWSVGGFAVSALAAVAVAGWAFRENQGLRARVAALERATVVPQVSARPAAAGRESEDASAHGTMSAAPGVVSLNPGAAPGGHAAIAPAAGVALASSRSSMPVATARPAAAIVVDAASSNAGARKVAPTTERVNSAGSRSSGNASPSRPASSSAVFGGISSASVASSTAGASASGAEAAAGAEPVVAPEPTSPIPVAFAESETDNPEMRAGMRHIQEKFFDEVAKIEAEPDPRRASDVWDDAARLADARFRALYGHQAWRAKQRAQNLAGDGSTAAR